ncbi:MAG TPA: SRPBCC family protein [Steroidobacteraceae bacterium]|nr:SRPBCC family protein [Steroidobacteraceae bacterium]
MKRLARHDVVRRVVRVGVVWLLSSLSLWSVHAPAMAVDRLDVRRAGGRYIVEFEARLEAPAQEVGEVLTDYESYPALDPRILESRVDASRRHLHTKLRGCVGRLLCRTMTRVEEIVSTPDALTATALPLESDVKYGVTRSQWRVRDGGTQVTYRLEIEPDFWVPPMFGPRLMIKTLREGTLSLFRNVETAAQARDTQKREHLGSAPGADGS